jgi:cyanophycin synthetase
LTFGGKAKFMIGNILAASLAAYLFGFKTEGIRLSLETFIPSPALTPGRMNIFYFKNFTVMIDFAHNPAGFIAINEFLSTINSPKKIGIIAGVGDRRDQDIVEVGRMGAIMFDHIIIRQEKNLRGRLEEDIVGLIIQGIKSVDKNVTFETVPKEIEAIKHAISIAEPGTFITALSDVVTNAIDIVQEYLDKEVGI